MFASSAYFMIQFHAAKANTTLSDVGWMFEMTTINGKHYNSPDTEKTVALKPINCARA
jgi:hypothetical protein